MALDIYTPQQLYSVMYDRRMEAPASWFLDNLYPRSFMSTTEEILFDKITSPGRQIAPFMLPNEPGKPIYRRDGERLMSFKPAYTKPKDAVRPGEMLALQPGEIANREALMTPQSRFDREVIRITQFHRNSIVGLWEYMAAKAALNGSIVINYVRDAGSPSVSVTLDFGRDAGHTITLGSGSRWGESGVSIWGNLQTWIDVVANAEFGGSVQDVILGAQAAIPFMVDTEILAKMDNTFTNQTGVNINRGIIRSDPMQPMTLIGTLGSGIRVWRYTGFFVNADKSKVQIMDPRDVLLVAPGFDGVKAFGAIQEVTNLEPTDIFVKMWDADDPSARFIMSQSAPLMIPQNPNTTLRARVVA